MLDIIRKKASSWIVKFLLGLIVAVFILYFGTTTLRRAQQHEGHDIAAFVNGDPIYYNELKGHIQQLKDSNPTYQNLPANLEPMIESNVLNGLVEEKVIVAEALKLGLRVSDEEIATIIRTKSGLAKEGKFDELDYRERFRPGFFNRYGFDYEEGVKNGLLIEKLKKTFDNATLISEAHLKNTYALDHTRLKLKKIEINPGVLDKDKEAGMKKAKDLASTLWPTFTSGQSLEATLKKNNLKEEETPPTPLTQISSLFAGVSDVEAGTSLLALTSQKPYPAKPLEVGNRIYFFKLVEKEIPSWDEFEKNKKAEQAKLQSEIAEMAFNHWVREKVEKAKIEIKDQPVPKHP